MTMVAKETEEEERRFRSQYLSLFLRPAPKLCRSFFNGIKINPLLTEQSVEPRRMLSEGSSSQ